jgi:predicted GNAT superfamily acetyltransferase
LQADLPSIAALNNEHAMEIGPVDIERLQALVAVAVLATGVGPAGRPDAFLLAFDQHTPAQGPNHAWFLARRERFLYVDRVCVAAAARRRGLARALYSDALDHAARSGAEVLCCEIYSNPLNRVSDAFHASLGFVPVGEAYLPDRGKSVCYLERRL